MGATQEEEAAHIIVIIEARGREGGSGPPIFETTKTSAISRYAQSRFSSIVCDGVLGHPRLAQHT